MGYYFIAKDEDEADYIAKLLGAGRYAGMGSRADGFEVYYGGVRESERKEIRRKVLARRKRS